MIWIKEKNGKLVYGGTKYIGELKKLTQYFGTLSEYEKKGKIVIVDRKSVDDVQLKIENIIPNCNDAHLIAILNVSGCRIVCTLDRRAHKHLKKKEFYPKKMPLPRIYSSRKNKNLLCDGNIANICR